MSSLPETYQKEIEQLIDNRAKRTEGYLIVILLLMAVSLGIRIGSLWFC